jgi:hypothetical protein
MLEKLKKKKKPSLVPGKIKNMWVKKKLLLLS